MPSKNFIGQTFDFLGINGNNYTLSALTLEDWGKFVVWVQYKPYRDAQTAQLPDNVLKEILKECQRGKTTEEISEGEFEEFDINFSSTIVQEYLMKQEGMFYLLLNSLNKHHTLTTLSEVFSLDPSENPDLGLVDALNKLLDISNVSDNEETAEDGENPTNPNSTNT